jgi:hypothetical protein
MEDAQLLLEKVPQLLAPDTTAVPPSHLHQGLKAKKPK